MVKVKEMNGGREGEMCNFFEQFYRLTEQCKVDVHEASLDDSAQSRNTEVSVIEEA